MPYIGRGSEGFGIRERYQYTATSGQTAFTGSDLNSKTLAFDNGSLVDVLLNGVVLKPTTDYNTSTANTVTLVSGASTSDEVMIIVYDVFALSDAMPKTGGAFTGALSGVDVNGTELILDADGDSSITADTDDTINFKAGGSDRLTINSSGDIDVETGDIFFSTAGKGINLGVTSNTDSNTLDDYEEGTFTPTFYQGMSAQSYSVANGTYVKIGSQVLVQIWLYGNSSGNTSSGAGLVIGNLPFVIGSASGTHEYNRGHGNVNYSNYNADDTEATFYGFNNTDRAGVGKNQGRDSHTAGSNGTAVNSKYFIAGFTYTVAF